MGLTQLVPIMLAKGSQGSIILVVYYSKFANKIIRLWPYVHHKFLKLNFSRKKLDHAASMEDAERTNVCMMVGKCKCVYKLQ